MRIFGLDLVTALDLAMLFESPKQIHHVGGMMIIDKMDFDRLKKRIFENGVKKFVKLRSRIVKKFGFLFWEEMPAEEAIK